LRRDYITITMLPFNFHAVVPCILNVGRNDQQIQNQNLSRNGFSLLTR